ncbi:MAG: hypothetical protein ACRCYQ_15025, partial [Nocardioides sp.]
MSKVNCRLDLVRRVLAIYRRKMALVALRVTFTAGFIVVTGVAFLRLVSGWTTNTTLTRWRASLIPVRSAPVPKGRPIEVIATHARRLCRQSRLPERGRSWVKQIAVQQAYDG